MMGTLVAMDGVEQRSLKQFAEQSYLDYAMYVILDRALPHLADGMKPVQRRIVYAMSELGLKSQAKFKKSARTVGDVLGKYHPHGDSACYEAMVLMAQPFSYRYPLVDGQGNWGSPDDPKSFAAMRYTESRLTAYAGLLLAELGQGTVDWQPNFDATLDEPCLLPAQVPNVLLNGSIGIAVGMATDIPPHNLGETLAACMYLLDHPQANLEDVMILLPGPDYPSCAEIITPRAHLAQMYASGTGSIKMRATYEQEQATVIIEHLPYQSSGSKILMQIADQMNAKKLPQLVDIRDESDHENPTRLVLSLRSHRVDVEELMGHLFATTDLERSYRVNLNMIGLDGRPKVMPLMDLLRQWLSFRISTLKRRLQYRLEKVLARLHLLEGLLIAYLNLDEVIRIIREDDEPKATLCRRFGLSELQADAILDMKLRHLAKLEEIKIRGEQRDLTEEQQSLEAILGSSEKMKALLKTELMAIQKAYDSPRRSPIVERAQATAISEDERVGSDPVTVVLSQKAWVRQAKGHEVDPLALSYKAGDGYAKHVYTRLNCPTLFLDSTGRCYTVATHKLPSSRGQGEALSDKVKLTSGAETVDLAVAGAHRYLVASTAGYGFWAPGESCLSKNRSGKQLIHVPEHAQPLGLYPDDGDATWLALISQDGRMLIIEATTLPSLEKGKGVKLIQIPAQQLEAGTDCLAYVCPLQEQHALLLHTKKRKKILSPEQWHAYCGVRAKRGRKLPKGFTQPIAVSTQ